MQLPATALANRSDPELALTVIASGQRAQLCAFGLLCGRSRRREDQCAPTKVLVRQLATTKCFLGIGAWIGG
jgi:hypothetical protein